MDQADFVTPDPSRISEFSPTLANQLAACQLRVAFARDPRQRHWRRPSTYGVLGVAAHAVTEAAFRRRDWPSTAGEVRTLIEGQWDEEVMRGTAALEEAWAPAKPPPSAEWPGFALTRARTVRRALRVAAAATTKGGATPEVGSGIEIELRDPISGLLGRADRIESDGGSTRVVDLKTGIHQDDPTDEQRRQLLLYAVLVHRNTGRWPSTIAVEDASGFQHELPFDPADAESTLHDVTVAVGSFNDKVENGGFLASADPSPDRCRWCAYRVLCQPFWDEVAPDWDQRAAIGTVVNSGSADTGWFVSLNLERPKDREGDLLQISSLPEPIEATVTKTAVVDWVGRWESGGVRARWSTLIRAW